VSSSAAPSKPLIAGLSTLVSSYDVILCDIWGVLHNGIEGYRAASDALVKFREQGGRVILVSNAPRPSSDIVGMLDRFSVSRRAYDGIVTSGDVTRAVLLEGNGTPIIGSVRNAMVDYSIISPYRMSILITRMSLSARAYMMTILKRPKTIVTL